MTRIVVHKYVNDGSRFQMKSIDRTNIIEIKLKPSCWPIKDKSHKFDQSQLNWYVCVIQFFTVMSLRLTSFFSNIYPIHEHFGIYREFRYDIYDEFEQIWSICKLIMDLHLFVHNSLDFLQAAWRRSHIGYPVCLIWTFAFWLFFPWLDLLNLKFLLVVTFFSITFGLTVSSSSSSSSTFSLLLQ